MATLTPLHNWWITLERERAREHDQAYADHDTILRTAGVIGAPIHVTARDIRKALGDIEAAENMPRTIATARKMLEQENAAQAAQIALLREALRLTLRTIKHSDIQHAIIDVDRPRLSLAKALRRVLDDTRPAKRK